MDNNLNTEEKATRKTDVSGSTDEFKKCASCGKEMNMTKNEFKTVMHNRMHRYVCSGECVTKYYR